MSNISPPSLTSYVALLCACVTCLFSKQADASPGAALSNVSETSVQLASALNNFGEELFAAVMAVGDEPSSGGAFLSPFGASQALGMLLNGVEPGGESAQQLQAVLLGTGPGEEVSVEELNAEMSQLAEELVEAPSGSSLNVTNANSAWVEGSYQLQQGFQQSLAQYFNAEVQPITTAQAVNSWVGDATGGRITQIVDQDTLEDAAVLLINALYFKGQWEAPFRKEATRAAPFRQLSGATLDAAMMCKEFSRKEREAVQVARFTAPAVGDSIPCVAVRLGYQGGKCSAVFTMPEGDVSSTGPLRLLSPALGYRDALAACRGEMARGIQDREFSTVSDSLILYLPRFEIEYESSLKAPLQQLGLTKPFSPSQGTDLTSIATTNGGPATDLYVSDVLQKVFVKVDETGTEAAAATAVMIMPTSAPLNPPQTITFDRPFAAAVVHDPSGGVLFVGEVQEPEGWSGGG